MYSYTITSLSVSSQIVNGKTGTKKQLGPKELNLGENDSRSWSYRADMYILRCPQRRIKLHTDTDVQINHLIIYSDVMIITAVVYM